MSTRDRLNSIITFARGDFLLRHRLRNSKLSPVTIMAAYRRLGVPKRGSEIADMGARLLRNSRPSYLKRDPGLDSFYSARDTLNLICFGPDPRPRNTLGQFGGEEPGAPNPHAIGMVYKQPGALRTNLMEGAAGGVGFAGAGAAISGLKGLAQKMKKGAKRMSARDKLDAILHL